jgi:hypothetical protein
LTLAYYLRKII